jgi:cytochrome P450
VPAFPHDLTDLELFAYGFPHQVFALHRRERPIFWHEPTPHTPDHEGFWSVATHPDTLAILHDPETFSSETGGSRPYGGTVLTDLPTAGKALNMMDDPRHQRVRALVSKGLTPRVLARMEAELRRRTRALLEAVAPKGACDFVTEVATELPMQAISLLLGTPVADRHRLFEWVDHSFDFRSGDAVHQSETTARDFANLHAYGAQLIAEKRQHPGEDMLSVVIHATLSDVDPPRLSDEELLLFLFLLFAAGSDTTRNAIAGGLLALIDNPAELVLLEADLRLVPVAAEEMVRWTSPAAYNRRTATRDVDFRGHQLRAGDKVVFWEASANRDEQVFEDAMRFHVRRDPNPHLGFGHGVHHCLGANLARLEMRLVFEELLARFTDFALAGPPEWTRSNKHTGLRHLPIRYAPRRR